MDPQGNQIRTIKLPNEHSLPAALGVYDNRLYYLDPKFELIARVDLNSGENQRNILENEPDLKTFIVHQKQQIGKLSGIVLVKAYELTKVVVSS